jgi:hypothetical protein
VPNGDALVATAENGPSLLLWSAAKCQDCGQKRGVAAPAGSAPAAEETTSAPAVASSPVPAASSDFDDEEPAVASAPVEAKPSTQKAEDILAMIRARQKQ